MERLKVLWRSQTIRRGLISLLVYPIAASLISREMLVLIMNLGVFSFSLSVVVAYWPNFVEAVLKDKPTPGDQLVMGIVMSWSSEALLRNYAAFYNASGRPEWMVLDPLWGHMPGMFLWIGFLGAILHISVPDAISGKIPERRMILIGIAVALIVMIVAAFMAVETSHGGDGPAPTFHPARPLSNMPAAGPVASMFRR